MAEFDVHILRKVQQNLEFLDGWATGKHGNEHKRERINK